MRLIEITSCFFYVLAYYHAHMTTTATPSGVFEHLGYFEELIDATSFKCYGTRKVDDPQGRECGYAGRREETLIATVHLDKGHKSVLLKASPAKPVRVVTMLHVLCGRTMPR